MALVNGRCPRCEASACHPQGPARGVTGPPARRPTVDPRLFPGAGGRRADAVTRSLAPSAAASTHEQVSSPNRIHLRNVSLAGVRGPKTKRAAAPGRQLRPRERGATDGGSGHRRHTSHCGGTRRLSLVALDSVPGRDGHLLAAPYTAGARGLVAPPSLPRALTPSRAPPLSPHPNPSSSPKPGLQMPHTGSEGQAVPCS